MLHRAVPCMPVTLLTMTSFIGIFKAFGLDFKQLSIIINNLQNSYFLEELSAVVSE